MKTTKKEYHIFKGWYRRSLAKNDLVWHRVHEIGSVVSRKQMAHTICGRNIPTTNCDFHTKPDNKCLLCEKSHLVCIEEDRGFAPIGPISIPTRSTAIAEMKRLLKPRIYYLKFWQCQGVKIKAMWESYNTIDLYSYPEEISPHRKKNVISVNEMRADLGRFQSSIDSIIKACKILALQEKKNNHVKGRLTKAESYEYFDNILYEAEK